MDARVTLTSQAGTTGADTAVMLTLDLSGSMAGTKLANLKQAAKDTLAALDAADGATDSSIARNSAGLVVYQGSGTTLAVAPGASYNTLVGDIDGLPAPNGGSPHNAGIDSASAALAGSGFAKAIVLITDGQADGSLFTATTASANAAKSNGIRIVPIGIGTGADVSQSNLQSWASQASYYQSGTPGPIDKAKLISDLDAAVAVPTNFTVTETLGANFSAAPLSSSTGTVTTGAGTLQWTGSLAGSGTATLDYRATRNGNQVFATTNELVSTLSLAVSGGTATVTPPTAISIDVLPCGATPIASTTCTGAACSVSGTQGGVQYTANAGTPPAGTTLTLSSLNAPAPPAGVCAGFTSLTQGAEFDVRPLSTDSTLRMVIPKASLGTRRWFETNVCLGTNLKFITAIRSLFDLSPQATFVPGGTVPGRWWGLLPSIPRFEFFPGRGFVLGPYITSRSVDSAGNAIITFKVPFVANSTGLTTDGKPAYDPKLWGG
ncbi:MAG TPA: VWA domain-containing protein [Gaiellales bacterium]|nr:VWA domain-containing protein [Gaiellales bacterium]